MSSLPHHTATDPSLEMRSTFVRKDSEQLPLSSPQAEKEQLEAMQPSQSPPPGKRKTNIHPALIVLGWVVLSSSVVLFK